MQALTRKSPVLALLGLLAAYAHAGVGDGSDPLAVLKGDTGNGQQEFLEPDRAFVLSVEAADGNIIKAHWEIAQGYYLYRDKFTFKVDGQGVSLGDATVPAGEIKEDPYFGQVEIMHGAFTVYLPVTVTSDAAEEISLTVGYQGCAEAGICYPPITKTLPVTLRNKAQPLASAGGTDTGDPLLSDTDKFAGLLGGGAAFPTLAAFFGVGLLLAFTPCVFPMVPILSGIIVGQRERVTPRRAFVLSAVYVLAMALTYALAGVAAGMFGQNLQVLFQKPAVIAAFAAVFVLLALSMFGFYELQMPSRWQTRLAELSNRQRVGSLAGVAVMGVLSAIIVGPCVAPPLAGALVYIGRSGDALLGGAALFAMALGMGTPLLAIGASTGHLLPRTGAWMETVKKGFGVLMLAVAVWFLERILPGPVTLALWAALFIVTAVYLGAFDRLEAMSSGWQRLGKGLGLAAGVYGAVLLAGAASGHDDPLRPLARFINKPASSGNAATADTVPRELEFQPVRGTDGLQAALKAAGGRPVMLDFYADWCVECKKLERETFADTQVRRALSETVLLRADVTANDTVDQALLKDLGLFGPPAILFFDPQGNEQSSYRLQGFLGPEPFARHAGTATGSCKTQEQTQSYC